MKYFYFAFNIHLTATLSVMSVRLSSVRLRATIRLPPDGFL